MRNYLLSIVFSLCLVVSSAFTQPSIVKAAIWNGYETVDVYVDGVKYTESECPAVLIDGKVFIDPTVPLLGYRVYYKSSSNTLQYIYDWESASFFEKNIRYWSGLKVVDVLLHGEAYTDDIPGVMINYRAFANYQAINELYEYNASYNTVAGAVYITTVGNY